MFLVLSFFVVVVALWLREEKPAAELCHDFLFRCFSLPLLPASDISFFFVQKKGRISWK